MKSCDTCTILLFTSVIIISKQLAVAPICCRCQPIMAEWSKVIDSVFKLLLIVDFSLSL